jgi:hypothetical protein
MADLLRFVDAISGSPTTRLDLNDDSKWGLNYTGTSFDPPPRRLSMAGTLLADGRLIPAGAYDNRTIRLNVDLKTSSVDAQADEIQKLARELERPFNYLQWQPTGATSPVFFRTLWSAEQSITEYPGAGKFRTIAVELLAEPFGYGVKQTLSPVAVANDPASGCYFEVTGVKGDVETPLIMTIEYGDVMGKGPTAIAVRRKGTPSSMPFALQAEAMTGGTNTTIQANDAVMSGAGQNYMQCTYASAAMADRLTSAVFPSSASTDARGVYRPFLRYRRANNTAAYTAALKQTSGSQTATNDAEALALTTDRRYIELGRVQIPFGVDPVYDGTGAELSARGTIYALRSEKVSGSGNVDFDVFVFMPVDDTFCMITWPTSSGPTSMVVDGPNDAVYPIGASGEIYPQELVARTGSLPWVSPGVTNRVLWLLNAGGASSTVSDDKTSSVDITPAYVPRYLHVRPAST